jgi:hypothetical protein
MVDRPLTAGNAAQNPPIPAQLPGHSTAGAAGENAAASGVGDACGTWASSPFLSAAAAPAAARNIRQLLPPSPPAAAAQLLALPPQRHHASLQQPVLQASGRARAADLFAPHMLAHAQAALRERLDTAYAAGYADGIQAGRQRSAARAAQRSGSLKRAASDPGDQMPSAPPLRGSDGTAEGRQPPQPSCSVEDLLSPSNLIGLDEDAAAARLREISDIELLRLAARAVNTRLPPLPTSTHHSGGQPPTVAAQGGTAPLLASGNSPQMALPAPHMLQLLPRRRAADADADAAAAAAAAEAEAAGARAAAAVEAEASATTLAANLTGTINQLQPQRTSWGAPGSTGVAATSDSNPPWLQGTAPLLQTAANVHVPSLNNEQHELPVLSSLPPSELNLVTLMTGGSSPSTAAGGNDNIDVAGTDPPPRLPH